MDWEIIAPMVMSIVFILTVGGVLVFRPVAKHLGALLEAMARERTALPPEELRHLRDALETLQRRMELLEERQEFTERLLDRGGGRRAEPPLSGGPALGSGPQGPEA